MARPARQWPKIQYTVTSLGGGVTAGGQAYAGGLDLTTPTLRLQSGALTDSLNFECAVAGGYARSGGYERRDGRAAPSDAVYSLIQVDAFTNIPDVGLTVTQATSGATGTIIAAVDLPTSYLVVTQVVGTFDSTHALTVPGPIAVGTATAFTLAPLDSRTKAIYRSLAADVYRALIGAVPGSGTVYVVAAAFSGVDHLYAFRPNLGNTAIAIYKASTSGWTLVPFYKIVSFTAGGTSEPAEGTTLTQGGVTATIKRVMSQSGVWSGSSAAGQFVITTPGGGNFAAGAATIGGIGVTLSGVQTTITLAVGGRFEFDKTNFSGQASTRRIYGCDGVNKMFEFDGDVLAPIKTGLSPDTPSHITSHKGYLIAALASSLVGSGPDTPFRWTATDGGWEIATGSIVNCMITLPGDKSTATLGVFMNDNPAFLYGTSPSDFNFVAFDSNIGAMPYTAQNFFDTFFLDALGVVTLKTTLNWGNFLPTTLTQNILPFISRERSKTAASTINREKAQYRLFFNDGYALYCTIINQRYLGAMPQLFPNPVASCDETTLIDGSEATYFGSSDGLGYVYQLDKGTSFDGANINAYFVTAWDAVKSPRVLKAFRTASIEVQGEGYAQISFNYQLAYGNPQTAQPFAVSADLNLSLREYWDRFVWDEFVWDGANLMPTDIEEVGDGENIQVTISSGTNYMSSFTVDSIIHHYTLRRGMRV